MSRRLLLLCLFSFPLVTGGCSMCCGPFDFEYPMLDNARYVRMDPEYGRVGSIFSDPNADMGTVALTNADVPAEELPELEGIDSGGDDPNFNLDRVPRINDSAPESGQEQSQPEPGAIDTSARAPQRFVPPNGWR